MQNIKRSFVGIELTRLLASEGDRIFTTERARTLAPRVGLDVARVSVGEVEHGPTRETAIQTTTELGKYVTQRIYVAFRRVFGVRENENSSEGVFEYRISPHWFLMTVFGDAGVGSVDLLWTKRY